MIQAPLDTLAAYQVNISPKKFFQLILHIDMVKQGPPGFWLKSDQNVNIAVLIKIITHGRTKQSKLFNQPFSTKSGNFRFRNLYG